MINDLDMDRKVSIVIFNLPLLHSSLQFGVPKVEPWFRLHVDEIASHYSKKTQPDGAVNDVFPCPCNGDRLLDLRKVMKVISSMSHLNYLT